MGNIKTGPFIISLIFHGWKNGISLASLLGIVGFFLAPAMNSKWEIKYSFYIMAIGIIISFIYKVIKQYYQLFIKEDTKSIAIRIIEGDGLYSGKKVIVFCNNSNVSKNQILTMYCESSGAPQPICMLRVLDVTEKEIIADQYPVDIESIGKYFEEESRKKATYFSKNIDFVFLENQVIGGSNL